MADYDRSTGYVYRNVTISFETKKFTYDRGAAFTVDAMDDEETAGLAFGSLAADFMRTNVIPEMDAVRFATYAGKSGIQSHAAAALVISGQRKFLPLEFSIISKQI